jgi:uncharacterized membrane protein YfcA
MPSELAGNPMVLYLVLGLVAGVIGATFGVGGGIIMVPILTYIAAFPQKEAQGISLTVMIPLALMSAFRYHMNPEISIDWRATGLIILTVLIGSNLGASLAFYASNRYLKIGFAILLFITGFKMIMDALRTTPQVQ